MDAGRKVHHKLGEVNSYLEALGITLQKGPTELLNNVFTAQRWVGHASVVWLTLLSKIPGQDYALPFLLYIEWQLLHKDFLQNTSYVLAQPAFCHVLAQPELLRHLQELMSPHELMDLVCRLEVTADKLQAAGMPAAQTEQLLSKAGNAAVDTNPSDTAHGGMSAGAQFVASNGRSAGNGSRAETDSKRLAPATGAGYGEADGDDGGLDDVQALLQQMYGCTFTFVEGCS